MGSADVDDDENCKSFKNIKNPLWPSLPCHVAFSPNLLARVPHVSQPPTIHGCFITENPQINPVTWNQLLYLSL